MVDRWLLREKIIEELNKREIPYELSEDGSLTVHPELVSQEVWDDFYQSPLIQNNLETLNEQEA